MFDKIKFAKILKNINETYDNQTDFAKASGVNRTYLSQYMNQKLPNPPTPKVLLGISNASKGITTYEELMQVCGYIFLTQLTPSSYGIKPEHWNMIFGNADTVKITQKGSTFLASIFDMAIKEAQASENDKFSIDLNPNLLIPSTEDNNELIEYTRLFCFFLCAISDTVELKETDKNKIVNNVKELLSNIPTEIQELENENNTNLENVRFANAGGLDVSDLDDEEIEEIKRQIEYMRWKKKNGNK